MNIFSAKSIGLYSLAIASAIGFFQLVTSYGEANIKAPISITGNYLITATNSPACLHQKSLLLKLQQSGIYLNASLVNNRQEPTTIADSQPTFSGRLEDRQLSLIGLLPKAICPESLQLRMVGSIAKISDPTDLDRKLQGQIWLTSQDRHQTSPVDFTATLQRSTKSAQPH
jgi:hypothetical protein